VEGLTGSLKGKIRGDWLDAAHHMCCLLDSAIGRARICFETGGVST